MTGVLWLGGPQVMMVFCWTPILFSLRCRFNVPSAGVMYARLFWSATNQQRWGQRFVYDCDATANPPPVTNSNSFDCFATLLWSQEHSHVLIPVVRFDSRSMEISGVRFQIEKTSHTSSMC